MSERLTNNEIKQNLLDFMIKHGYLYLSLSYIKYENKKLYNENQEKFINLTPLEIKTFDSLHYITKEEFNDFYFRERKVKETVKGKKGKIIQKVKV